MTLPPRTARFLLLGVLLGVLVGAALAGEGVTIEAAVTRVVDGDTIHVEVNGRSEKLRYIGINTPEISHAVRGEEPGGREAAEINRQLVAGKRVRLELEV